MNRTELLWWHLNVLTFERYQAVLEVYGSLDAATKHISEEFLRGLGCREETAREVLMRMEDFDAALEEAKIEECGVTALSVEDPRYPRVLKVVADPPVFLSFRGDLSILDQPCLGLVGTRESSHYGRRVTQDMVPDFVRAGLVTVSGLALGIDAEVAEETIKAGGKTVAVLGHGLGSIYPAANQKLAQKIVDHGGLLLSEFPILQKPEKYTFPARNRIIAGLTLGTVVFEAPVGSGALITADIALGYGRAVFAVPGSIYDENYAGCHALIAKGAARLITTASDVLKELGIVAGEAPAASTYEAQSPDEEKILSALTSLPQPVDDLVEKSGLAAGNIGATLTMLELAGAARNVGGGMWVKM